MRQQRKQTKMFGAASYISLIKCVKKKHSASQSFLETTLISAWEMFTSERNPSEKKNGGGGPGLQNQKLLWLRLLGWTTPPLQYLEVPKNPNATYDGKTCWQVEGTTTHHPIIWCHCRDKFVSSGGKLGVERALYRETFHKWQSLYNICFGVHKRMTGPLDLQLYTKCVDLSGMVWKSAHKAK